MRTVQVDIRPKPEGTGGSAGLPPSDQVIKQTASTVEISETAFGQVRTRTYSFDGAPNTNKSGATTAVTHSKWIGNKFVTEGKLSQVTSAGYDEWAIKETRWLTPAGVMMIEYESVGLDGSKRSSTRTMRRKS